LSPDETAKQNATMYPDEKIGDKAQGE